MPDYIRELLRKVRFGVLVKIPDFSSTDRTRVKIPKIHQIFVIPLFLSLQISANPTIKLKNVF